MVYRGTDGDIHSLYWTGTGAVGHDNLSGVAGTPKAAGDPVAYYTAHDDVHQVVYRGVDDHLYELWWEARTRSPLGPERPRRRPPQAEGDPAAYYSAGSNTKHVLYRQPPACTRFGGAKRGARAPSTCPQVRCGPGGLCRRHRGHPSRDLQDNNGHLHELWWPRHLDVCRTHGFAFEVATESWRGSRRIQ